MWFGVHYKQEDGFSSAVKCKKGPQVLFSLLNQGQNYYVLLYAGLIFDINRIRVCLHCDFKSWGPFLVVLSPLL